MTRKRLSRESRTIEKTKEKTKKFEYFKFRNKSDIWINVAVFTLILFGTLMIVSTNVGQTTRNSSVVLTTVIKQSVFFVAAYICMWVVNRVFSFRWFQNMKVFAILGIGVFMICPFAFAAEGGSQAWIRLGPITIQPSEFAKPLIIVLVANAVYQAKRNKDMLKNAFTLYRYPIYGLIIIAILLFLQRDLGTLAIICMIFFSCILIFDHPNLVRVKKVLKAGFLIAVLMGGSLFLLSDLGAEVFKNTSFSHVATRIQNAKNPYTDIYDEGYQPANSLYGIASSNFVGKGIGASARKYGYLTQADNDYILAVTIEETGVFGLGLIVGLYALIIYRLFYYAFKTNEVVYKIVLVGTSTYLFMHFFLNVGGVAALIPFTGVPLLFISSGGSSLMAICIAMGLCQQCISQIRIKEMKS